jgi:hypothetical protein
MRGLTNTASEAANQAEAEVLLHINLHAGCIMAVKATIIQKVAPYSLSPKERWSKTLSNFHNN